jgi:uncharacterized membrane protein YkgB
LQRMQQVIMDYTPRKSQGTDIDAGCLPVIIAAQRDTRMKSSSLLGRLRRLFTYRPISAAVKAEERVIGWMARKGPAFTRVALGIVFLWFGVLKFMPMPTPIDALAERTLGMITLHRFRPELCLHALATWECLIGLGLLVGRFLRLTLILLFLQMPGTFLPLILLPNVTWVHFPVFPTFEGQYIIKNIVLISAGLIVGSMARGGKIIAHPEVAMKAAGAEAVVEERELRELEERSLREKDKPARR